MKLLIIDALSVALGGMKLNRISDKRVKNDLVNDYLHLRSFAKKAKERADEYREKFRDDWRDEMDAVAALRNEGKPVEGHGEYLEAEADAGKAIQDIYAEDVETSLKPVPMDAFLAACGGEDVTLEQIAFFQENGLIE